MWGGGIVLVLGMFLIFVAPGWPGPANKCITDTPADSCYCEAFNPTQVVSGASGVRQPVNTWFNLYSIITSLVVAVVVYSDRKTVAYTRIQGSKLFWILQSSSDALGFFRR